MMGDVLERNIQSLINKRRREVDDRSLEDMVADAITRFAGSMRGVYVHALIFGAWLAINLEWTPLPPFDPTFVVLAMVASVEAIFLSTFVLITQNRQSAQAEKRADLDLQISLLAEYEVTQLLKLARGIGRKLDVAEARDSALAELLKDIEPVAVLNRIEEEKHSTQPPV